LNCLFRKPGYNINDGRNKKDGNRMEKQLKESFLSKWGKFFPDTELPIAYF
jgi:hypothetical protein